MDGSSAASSQLDFASVNQRIAESPVILVGEVIAHLFHPLTQLLPWRVPLPMLPPSGGIRERSKAWWRIMEDLPLIRPRQQKEAPGGSVVSRWPWRHPMEPKTSRTGTCNGTSAMGRVSLVQWKRRQ